MATIYEVSKLAGVSLATVSRVINSNAPVRKETRDKVEAAMRELGYRPNSAAQSLASQRANSIGILVSELHGPFYGVLLSRIESQFRQTGKHVIIAAGHSDEALERESIEFLRSRNCDALILHVEAVSDDYLIDLAADGCAFVLINRMVPQLADRCITLNNHHGGYLATRHMLEQGHRAIAYISGPMWKHDARERYKGHQQALAQFGVSENPALFFEGDFHETTGVDGFTALRSAGVEFTALVCANDEMASGALAAAHDVGILVPQQLSIMGFDNVNFAHYTHPKLTTIVYPIGDIAQMAARWVLRHVYHDTSMAALQAVFEPKLIERDSTQGAGS